jgi:predicted enzyme related to lactoylglutathione lyase
MAEGRVTGIGGVFIRSDDPKGLAAWYREHLGMVVTTAGEPDPDGNWNWAQEAGDMVFAMFPRDSDYFPAEKQVMLNFRVEGIDALVGRLAGAGIEITRRETIEGNGRFARIHDPEGNALELWEPPAAG